MVYMLVVVGPIILSLHLQKGQSQDGSERGWQARVAFRGALPYMHDADTHPFCGC